MLNNWRAISILLTFEFIFLNIFQSIKLSTTLLVEGYLKLKNQKEFESLIQI